MRLVAKYGLAGAARMLRALPDELEALLATSRPSRAGWSNLVLTSLVRGPYRSRVRECRMRR